MAKKIGRNFYLQPTLKVARNLLGKYIVHKIDGRPSTNSDRQVEKRLVGKIVETEAYIGPSDLASHARSGKVTPRNLAEYMIGGHIYIYLVYGMYWQLNISTGPSGRPECVLIRALEPINSKYRPPQKSEISRLVSESERAPPCQGRLAENIEIAKQRKLANGPGKLCRYLKLDKRHYGLDLVTSGEIWLEKAEKIPAPQIVASKRIGIDYAGRYWANKKWRYYIKNNPFVSKY